MLFCNMVNATEIYQWQDKDGNIHFSDSPPVEMVSTIAYRDNDINKIFKWNENNNTVQYGDTVPGSISTDMVEEFEPEVSSDIDDEQLNQYSIQNQLSRMSEFNQKLINARQKKEQDKIESYLLTQELNVVRMEEKIRTQGYGPRPYYYSYR